MQKDVSVWKLPGAAEHGQTDLGRNRCGLFQCGLLDDWRLNWLNCGGESGAKSQTQSRAETCVTAILEAPLQSNAI